MKILRCHTTFSAEITVQRYDFLPKIANIDLKKVLSWPFDSNHSRLLSRKGCNSLEKQY